MEKHIVLTIVINNQTQEEMGDSLEEVESATYDGEYLNFQLKDGSIQSVDVTEAPRPPLLPPEKD